MQKFTMKLYVYLSICRFIKSFITSVIGLIKVVVKIGCVQFVVKQLDKQIVTGNRRRIPWLCIRVSTYIAKN